MIQIFLSLPLCLFIFLSPSRIILPFRKFRVIMEKMQKQNMSLGIISQYDKPPETGQEVGKSTIFWLIPLYFQMKTVILETLGTYEWYPIYLFPRI